MRPALLGGLLLGALSVGGCAGGLVSGAVPARPQPADAASAPADAHRTPPRMESERVAAILAEAEPTPLDDDARRVLTASDGVPLRLVGEAGEHSALDLVLARAKTLLDEGADEGLLDVAGVEAARERLRRLREQGGAGLQRAMERLEVLGWRLALGVSRVLGGPRTADLAPERLPGELLSDPRTWLARLEPADPAYAVLVEALHRYRRMAAAAGDAETEVGATPAWTRLAPGETSPRVARLRARLREVGFPAPPVGEPERFDAAVERALGDFQRRHSLAVTGRPDGPTLEALGAPLAERVAGIEAALRHVRRSPARSHPDRIQVNIPAYRLHLVVGDRVAARHRVVVGSDAWVADPTGERAGRLNRTPTLASRVTRVVLNPSWHVPRRIKELELDPRARRDPGIYDGFELYFGADGVERAVQLPGPRNALGRVKFVFGGGGGVYLHDTPEQDHFERADRALSHGCVRVEAALDLARRVLAADRHPLRWSQAVSILRSGREAAVSLYRPLPIFLEYVLAGAGPDGEVRFYPDVYGWGQAVAAGSLPAAPTVPPPLIRRDPARR